MLFISFDLNAQVRGIIQDAVSLEPIPNANIVVKGTTKGTETATDGSFSLSIAQFPSTLQVSSLGYVPTEISVSSDKKRLIISLNPVFHRNG